jgi:two-component system NtrC family sensor kinase
VKQKHVLVIEDSVEMRRLLAELVIEPNDYRLTEAEDGEEGLELALQKHPDLIVLDVNLPKMDGFQVLAELRRRDVDVPIICTSVHQSPELILRAFRGGAQDFVVKPFDPQHMLAVMERVLDVAPSPEHQSALPRQLQEANRKLERRLQELNTLYTIGRSVTSLLDLNLVLNRVVEAAVYMTRAEEGMLMLLDKAGDELYLRAAKDIDKKTARNLRVRVDDSAAGRALQTERPVLLTGDRAKIVTGYLVQALLYVPLRVPERGAIGVLGVTNRKAQRTFGERDVFLLSALADYAAIAIENARLFSEVEEERAKLETVLRKAEEIVILTNEDNEIMLCNAAACDALGEVESDVIGQPGEEVFSSPVLQEMFEQARASRQVVHREVNLYEGKTFNAQLTPVKGVGYVLMMQDITHLKELDRVKSEFVATVSHDLRTPLTSIQGYVGLLSKVGPLNEQQRSFIRRVEESLDDITDLIGDLLDVGRIEAGFDLEMAPCDLRDIIDKSVQDLQPQAAEKQLDLRWELPESPIMIQGNARRLRQVMDNLVGNAVKYTEEGGWVAVTTGEEDGHAVVSVADNGIGIPPDQQPYVFDKFYRVDTEETADIKGTGLGLSIVKAVIEKHNGRVWVKSTPDVGSVFSFVLPALDDKESSLT